MKQEAKLKAAFAREMVRQLPHFVMLRYLDAGAPDREIVGNGITTRWEFKHGTPGFVSPGNQELCCMRLAMQGHCCYVLWMEDRNGENKRTMIVHPTDVHSRAIHTNPFNMLQCQGYDMKWLVGVIKKAHGL